MASSTSLPQVKVDFGYTLSVTVDFEADLTSSKTETIPLPVPLEGEWTFTVFKEEDGSIVLRWEHGKVQAAYFGEKMTRSLSFFWLQGEQSLRIAGSKTGPKSFPDVTADGSPYGAFLMTVGTETMTAATQRYNGRFDIATHRGYRVVCEIVSSCPELETLHRMDIAKRVADLQLEQLPSQLRLYFPSFDKDGAELWVSSDLVAKSTPYFKDLLSSDFSEATPRRSKRARKSGGQPIPVPAPSEKDFDDSDDETDAFLLQTKPPKLSESTEACEHPYREITVTQTSFATYHALLVYLETGYVRFAPLRSASSPSNPSASSSRNDFLSGHLEKESSLPLPISPKSMFRLADLLRLPDEDPLVSLCLRAFSDSLTHHGAAFELFSDTSVCFDKIRKIVLDYVVKNWDAVSVTPSWKDTADRIKRDEVAGSGPVLMELLQAREEQAKKKSA